MSVIPTILSRNLLLLGILGVGLWGCGQTSTGGSTGGTTSHAGGSGGTAAGGTTSNGGTVSSGGTSSAGGSVGTGGVTSSGGTQSTGGTTVMGTGGTQGPDAGAGGIQGTGGVTEKGGTTGAGGSNAGGAGNGGVMGSGGGFGRDGGPDGRTGTGGSTGPGGGPGTGGGTAVGGAGGTSSGACQKGQVKPSEVVFMGESFYAIDPQYNEKRVESNAQAAGALAAGAKYRNVAVSGQTMNYVATTEWPAATKGGTVKVVIMDGGGIDCMSSSCSSCPGDFTTLLGKMATEGVLEVIYTRYPEPGAPPGSNATLKGNLDILMPKMQTVCEGATGLKCHWVDLRPVWKDGDTTDGLHPTQSGGNHVGDAIWAEMVKDCIAQ